MNAFLGVDNMRRRYKVGAIYGHMGRGKGIEVRIPILAADVTHAIARAQKMGGVKKRFKCFWHVEEVGLVEFLKVQADWCRFKQQVRRKNQGLLSKMQKNSQNATGNNCKRVV